MFKKNIFIIIFVLLFLNIGTASAADYYVSTIGSDSNSGLSEAQAWRTIQHAADSVIAGDTVHVLAGTYNEAVTISKSGTEDQRIIFQGENYPVIDTTGTGFKISGDYVTVTGFSIKNANYGIWVYQADHVTITHNIMDDFSCTVGISVYGESSAPYTPIYYSTVENNTINSIYHAIALDYGIWGANISYNNLYTQSESTGTLYFWGAASDGTQNPPAYGWYYHSNFIGNTIRGGRNGFAGGCIYNCYIANNNISGYFHNGINLHSTQYSTIENNWIGESKGGDTQHAFYIDGSTRLWHDNIFRNNHVESASHGCGFNVNNAVNATVENLTVDYCGGEGIIIISDLYKITASGNWSFKNIFFNTNALSGVRFDGLDSTLDGDYRFVDIKISGNNLLSGWTLDSPGTIPTVYVINTNDITTRWVSGATGGEFRFYYPLDVKVVDTSGNPIPGATITITNDVNSNYPSINYKFENKTSFTTGADGHTSLPSDEENSAAIMDFRKTSSATNYMTYTITAEKDGHINSTTVNPDSSWYRSDSNTYQNTVTVLLDTGPDTTPPTITTHSPTGTDLAINTDISVTFSEEMDKTSAQNAFSISPSVSGLFSWDGNKMAFTPDSDLSYLTTYSADISTGAKDLSGNNMQSAFSWQFTIMDQDLTPSVISSVSAASITGSGATITWTTDELSTSHVEYGTTTSYGFTTSLDTNFVTSHSQTLTGLNPLTTYHYRVLSEDESGNLATSNDYTFTTHDVSTASTIRIWDTGQVETADVHYLSAWPYRSSWTEVLKGTTGEINNDLVLEGKSFWFNIYGSQYNANLGFMKGGYIPGDWSGDAATPDAPSRKNEMYRSFDTPNYYRAYGEGSETHNVLVNTEDEIIVRSTSFPTTKPDGSWAVTTDYRILNGKSWMEIIPVNQASEQGFHGETKIVIVPDGNGPGDDYVADVYDYTETDVGLHYLPTNSKMMLDFFMEGDGIWMMTWPNPETARPYIDWYKYGWPCGWDYVDGETVVNIWGAPFARFGDNGDEPIYVGFLNGKWTHAYWNYQNINQYLSQGTTYSNWQITFSRSPRYHESWTPLYPAIYRLIGKIDGNFYTQEMDLANIGDPIEFIMPVNGNLEYVLIYLYDRNTNTPLDISTPMDIYRETILVNVGNISGVVTDIDTGSAISSAIVTDGTRSAITDESGVCTIIDMPVRDHTITASAIGYETTSQNIAVIADQTIIVDFQLTPDTTAPTIIANTPTGTDVSVGSSISIIFSEAMNQISAESAFSILPSVSGSLHWDGNKMLFTPSSDFDYNTTYTVIMGTGAKDLGGNNLESPNSWVFTTIAYGTGEIGLWHFDEGIGGIVADSSGNSNDGTISGASWIDGKLGTALQFDGIDNHVSIPNSPSLNPADEITIEAWVKTGAILETSWDKIIAKPYTSHTSPWQQYALTLNDDHFVFELNAGGIKEEVIGTETLEPNTWYHVAGTYDGSEMRIYVNGELNGTQSNKSGAIAVYPTDVHIGAGIYSDAQTEYINGIIDEVRILDRALSADEVRADYEAGLEDTTPPIINAHSPTGTNVPVGTVISTTFSEPMNTSSAEDAFSVSPSLAGTFSWIGDTMTFTPDLSLGYETTYTVTIDTAAVDLAGNHLESPYSWQFTTETAPDTTPPIITSVNAASITDTSATGKWNTDEPSDSLVKYGTVSGVYTADVYNAADVVSHSIQLTGLSPDTTYYYVVNSTDPYGNSNESVEYYFTTVSQDTAPTLVTDPTAAPAIIPEDTDNDPQWGESSRLTVTVTDDDGIASVTIDLSAIGGSSAQPMTNIGGNTWSVNTSAAAGTPPQTYDLGVNATDIYGHSNTSVVISLTVVKNGDVNNDGNVDYMWDAVYLVRHTRNTPGYEEVLDGIVDVTGDGMVDFDDAVYLVRYTMNTPGYEILH